MESVGEGDGEGSEDSREGEGGRPEQAGLGRRGGENERGKILTSHFSLTLIRGFWGEAASVISQTCLQQTPFLHDELPGQGGS